MRNTYAYSAGVRLTRSQFVYLRDRYKKRDNVSATTLVQLALLEVVALQAEEELAEAENKVK